MKTTTIARSGLRTHSTSVTAAVTAALLLAAGAARAEQSGDGEAPKSTRGETTGVLGGLAVGAAAGGPIGAIVGAAAGAWIGDRFDGERHARRTAETALATSESQRRLADEQVHALHEGLAAMTQRDALARQIVDSADALATHVMFRTQETGVGTSDIEALTRLGRMLAPLGEVRIRIEGYADPRGPAELNAALSQERAESVAAVLRAAGVPDERLDVRGLGAVAAATEAPGSQADNHALMRRVTLSLELPTTTVARR